MNTGKIVLAHVLTSKYRECSTDRHNDLNGYTVDTVGSHISSHNRRTIGVDQTLYTHAAQGDHTGLKSRGKACLYDQKHIISVCMPVEIGNAKFLTFAIQTDYADRCRHTLRKYGCISGSCYAKITYQNKEKIQTYIDHRRSNNGIERCLGISGASKQGSSSVINDTADYEAVYDSKVSYRVIHDIFRNTQ